MTLGDSLKLGGMVSLVLAAVLIGLAVWVYLHDDIAGVRSDLAGVRRMTTEPVRMQASMPRRLMTADEPATQVDSLATVVGEGAASADEVFELVLERMLCHGVDTGAQAGEQ